MKLLLVLLVFLLNGCYLANGSPNSTEFWVKDGKRISYEERQFCFEKNKSKLKKKDKERFEYLKNRYKRLGYSNDGFSIMRTEYPNEYQEYLYLSGLIPSNAHCYYELGYKFRPPIYWCLAQDGDNTRICMENMKYRN